MSQKTIKLTNLPLNINKQHIRDAFHNYQLRKIHISENQAFILLNETNDIQTLQFVYDGLIVPALANAEINTVESDFSWEKFSDQEDEIQSLKSERSESMEGGEYPVLEPDYKRRIIVTGCNAHLLSKLTEQEMKVKTFEKFAIEKVRKVQKDQNQTVLVVDFVESSELQKLELIFEGLKIVQFGENARIDSVDEEFNIERMKDQWEKQRRKEEMIEKEEEKAAEQSSEYEKIEDNTHESPPKKVVGLKQIFIFVLLILLLNVILS